MLNPSLDIAALRQRFAATSRIQIADILQPAAAERLHRCLEREVPWTLAYKDGNESVRLSHDRLRSLTATERAEIERTIQARARETFQFMYNSYMMVEAYVEKRDPHLVLHQLLEFLNTPAFLDLIRQITDDREVIKADAQATRYIPGHFLKWHDDTQRDEGRRFAYVLSLTKNWQADWGGLLHFFDSEGNVIDTFMPRYNVLNLFKVPTPHCVSYVAPFAGGARYSITGWIRTDERFSNR